MILGPGWIFGGTVPLEFIFDVQVEVTMISAGVSLIYSFFMDQKKKAEREVTEYVSSSLFFEWHWVPNGLPGIL